MFVWLASYPKSGNTLTRSMLASYFFTEDGNYDFNLLKNILQFPEIGLFKKLGININNEKEVIKNYVRAQELVNKKKDELNKKNNEMKDIIMKEWQRQDPAFL